MELMEQIFLNENAQIVKMGKMVWHSKLFSYNATAPTPHNVRLRMNFQTLSDDLQYPPNNAVLRRNFFIKEL